jgi:hypothetical protein
MGTNRIVNCRAQFVAAQRTSIESSRLQRPDEERLFLTLNRLNSPDGPPGPLFDDLFSLATRSLPKPLIDPIHPATASHCNRVSAEPEWKTSDQF